MSDKIPDFQCNIPDGTRKRTRLEMDEWLRAEVPKVHWLRIHAYRTLDLSKNISFDMLEIVLRHWILDELIRRQLIIGDLLGVSATSYNDEAEIRQFTQRLTAMIQAGQAIQPQHAEGIDMNGYQPPPPPIGINTQTATPPGYPPGPPSAPPVGPQMPPGYAPGPQMPPGSPQQSQFAPPQAPVGPPGYSPVPSVVPMGPPKSMGPPGVPAPSGPPSAVPAAGRRGRRPDATPQATTPATPVPPMGPGSPPGFGPAGYATPPQSGFALPPHGIATQTVGMIPGAMGVNTLTQPQLQTPSTIDLSGVNQKLDQLITKISFIEKKIDLLSMINTVMARALYNQQGSLDVADFLREVNVPIPQ